MSTILVDNLTGKTSAGSITVTSEGGAATQSLQQGLAKAWINFDGTGTISTRDSLNVSSISDEGTGYYQYDFTNAMSNANYSASGTGGNNDNNVNRVVQFGDGYTTTALDLNTGDGAGTPSDRSVMGSQVFGDLA
jgi:hypothetical protein